MKPLTVRNLALVRDAPDDRLFNFEIDAGEIVVVLGGNGSGKSLLVSCLAGQRISPGASVEVCGHEVFQSRSRPSALAALGVMFQHPGLLRTLSVFDNVALPFLQNSLGLTGQLAGLVGLRLDLLGCTHLADADTGSLGEGDKRCVALARALSGTTRFLIADEPAAALSPETRARVEDLLTVLVGQGALDGALLCTQDLEFALRVGSRFLFLRDSDPATGAIGGIREERTSAGLFDHPHPPEISDFLSRRKEWQD
jgi:ABC-type sulfate/molybdate transport systems ATPase subunit